MFPTLMFYLSFLLLLLSSQTQSRPEVCEVPFSFLVLLCQQGMCCPTLTYAIFLRAPYISPLLRSSPSLHTSYPPPSSYSSQDMSETIQTFTRFGSPSPKPSRLDLQQSIQRGIVLATQLCHAASKEDLDSKEWSANQAAANELLRIFGSMQEKTVV